MLTEITQLFPHMRELLIILTGIINNSRIFSVWQKNSHFYARMRKNAFFIP